MDNSIYVALSRQMSVFRKMEMTSNNLANANTVGYHSEQLTFTDYLVDEGSRDSKLAFTQDISSWRDTTSGSMQQTGNPLDMAITGPGFFVVETTAGPRYTRAGNFTLGSDGTLMTSAGYPVLGDGGQRIEFDQEVKEIQVGGNGLIITKNQQGVLQEAGQLGLVEFADAQSLKRMNSQLFEAEEAPRPAETSNITQGAIEMSNVSPVSELVKVTQLSRSTNNTAKFIEVMYDLTRKTSNAYARASNT